MKKLNSLSIVAKTLAQITVFIGLFCAPDIDSFISGVFAGWAAVGLAFIDDADTEED